MAGHGAGLAARQRSRTLRPRENESLCTRGATSPGCECRFGDLHVTQHQRVPVEIGLRCRNRAKDRLK